MRIVRTPLLAATAMALLLSTVVLVSTTQDASSQPTSELVTCPAGRQEGIVCLETRNRTGTDLVCAVADAIPLGGSPGCYLIYERVATGECPIGTVPNADPARFPPGDENSCVRTVSMATIVLCASGFTYRNDWQLCTRRSPAPSLTLTCDNAEALLEVDKCVIEGQQTRGPARCPVFDNGNQAVVELDDGQCFEKRERRPDGECLAGFLPFDETFCARVADRLPGALTCDAGFQRVFERAQVGPSADRCVRYETPRGVPTLDCLGADRGSAGCYQYSQIFQGSPGGAVLADGLTTVSFYWPVCNRDGVGAATRSDFDITDANGNSILEGELAEGPADYFTGSFLAPSDGVYGFEPTVFCDNSGSLLTTPDIEELITIPSCNGQVPTSDMRFGGSGIGTLGNDVILGSSGPDLIDGQGGDDMLCGLGGDDRITGGAGRDMLAGGNGRDFMFGGDGNDLLFGGLGIDRMWGNSGSDELDGQGGSDRIRGGGGNDNVRAGSGADRVWGGPGNDVLLGMGGQDKMFGGPGDDVLQGNFQTDRLHGDAGNDVIRGSGGKDKIYGGPGDDLLFGGNNTDYLEGGGGTDTADGQRGKDNPLVVDVSGCDAEVLISC